jgi:hypothetical protein
VATARDLSDSDKRQERAVADENVSG